MTINLGSVDSPLTVAMLKQWAEDWVPGKIQSVPVHTPENSSCEHCGNVIVRDRVGFDWKHYPSFEKECYPRPTASPKRDAMGNVVPLMGK